MEYKQIVFDVDGTLIDTEYAVIHSLRDTITDITGKVMKINELTFALGITGEEALRRLGIKNIESALLLWEKNMLRYNDTICLFDRIEELLQALIRMGCKLGIVTSETKEEFKYTFTRFGINTYFDTVVCADDTMKHKPNPEPLLKYMELTKCNNKDLLYVGDSIYDMECAMYADVDFGLASWGANRNLDAMISFTTPMDVIKVLAD